MRRFQPAGARPSFEAKRALGSCRRSEGLPASQRLARVLLCADYCASLRWLRPAGVDPFPSVKECPNRSAKTDADEASDSQADGGACGGSCWIGFFDP